MNIIITGAGRGIGYETVKYFSGNGTHTIISISRNSSNLQKLKEECSAINPETSVIPLAFDLTGLLENENVLKDIIGKYMSHIDILINNAGYLHTGPFETMSKNEAKKMLDINFLAPSFLIREILPMAGKSKPCHIINITSMGGLQGSSKYKGLSYYSASKAALTVLTECLSQEYSDTLIYFNCLALGAVATEMLAEAFPGYQAPLKPGEIAEFIAGFALTGHKYFRGKILPVALSNP
jgi:NAD(P)-dependent dehydrogenase (short-subunit alcohol dehydrogenase family)